MTHPQLQASRSRPQFDHLARCITSPLGVYGGLSMVAGHHLAVLGAAPFRGEVMCTQNGHVFAHPDDIVDLLDALFTNVERLFAQTETLRDEFVVAAFAAYGVLAIHPFANANGRTAIDFAQLLLMARLGSPVPMLEMPTDVHRTFGPFFMMYDVKSVSPAAADLANTRALLLHRFMTVRIEDLRTCALRHVAHAMFSVYEMTAPTTKKGIA